jgi:hypothetical protein
VIRPILYVNLPAVVYALDRHARTRRGQRGEFARFLCAPDAEAPRSGVTALLHALVLINPNTLTWICEDRWRLLGLAQARRRTAAAAWDLAYLATITPPPGQPAAAATNGTSAGGEVLLELLQYTLDAAIVRGVQRVFARIDDDAPEMEIFARAGFQRYAREVTYALERPPSRAALDALGAARDGHGGDGHDGNGHDGEGAARLAAERELALRPWHRHDAWGLWRLADASTPRRVQVAECLTSEEFIATETVGGRMRSLPLIEREVHAYVVDRGVRLGGWLRLRFGRGTQPHQLWLMAHPEDASLAGPLLRFGLRQFAGAQPRSIVCRVREYDGVTIDALRAAGFAHTATRALLVRHLMLRALRPHTVPAMESRVAYGVKGLGTAPSHYNDYNEGGTTIYATRDH